MGVRVPNKGVKAERVKEREGVIGGEGESDSRYSGLT